MQDSYPDQRHYKPNPQNVLENLQPSGYVKRQADLHTVNVLGCYYSHQYNAMYINTKHVTTLFTRWTL